MLSSNSFLRISFYIFVILDFALVCATPHAKLVQPLLARATSGSSSSDNTERNTRFGVAALPYREICDGPWSSSSSTSIHSSLQSSGHVMLAIQRIFSPFALYGRPAPWNLRSMKVNPWIAALRWPKQLLERAYQLPEEKRLLLRALPEIIQEVVEAVNEEKVVIYAQATMKIAVVLEAAGLANDETFVKVLEKCVAVLCRKKTFMESDTRMTSDEAEWMLQRSAGLVD